MGGGGGGILMIDRGWVGGWGGGSIGPLADPGQPIDWPGGGEACRPDSRYLGLGFVLP